MSAAATPGRDESADLVVLADKVRTLDPTQPEACGVAARDGVIVAVGTHREVLDLAGSMTRVIDGPDLVVTPGLVDGHQHPLLGLEQNRGVDLSDVRDVEALRAALRTERTRLRDGDWLIGYGVNYDVFTAGCRMHRDLIDAAVAGNPAWLWLADVHTALLSSEALRQAGITGPVEFADHAEIVVDDRGLPTGQLHEMSAIRHAYRAVPPPDCEEMIRRLSDLFVAQNRAGLTGAHIMDLWPGTEEVLDRLEAEDRLSMRLRVAPWVSADSVADSVAAAADLRDRRDAASSLWTAGAVKLFMDGVIDSGSAWLSRPDCYGQSTQPQWLDPREYAVAVRLAVEAGLSCWTHAIGDAAVGYVLDAYADAGVPARGRHRVEHIEVLDDADVARFADLDVVASMQPTHMDWCRPDRSDNWSIRVGPDRQEQAWRYRDLADAGAAIAFGSDWPIAHFDPRVVMAGAQLRHPVSAPDQPAYLPQQAVNASQALQAFTACWGR
jgi:predicted amidohydrolase YtcJ